MILLMGDLSARLVNCHLPMSDGVPVRAGQVLKPAFCMWSLTACGP